VPDGLLDAIAHPYTPPSFADAMARAQSQSLALQQGQFDLRTAQMNRAYSMFAPVAGRTNPTMDDIYTQTGNLQRQGLPADAINTEISSLLAQNYSPREIARTLSEHAISPATVLGGAVHGGETSSPAGTTLYSQPGPMAQGPMGPPTVTGFAPAGVSPEAAHAPTPSYVPTRGPDGQVLLGPDGQPTSYQQVTAPRSATPLAFPPSGAGTIGRPGGGAPPPPGAAPAGAMPAPAPALPGGAPLPFPSRGVYPGNPALRPPGYSIPGEGGGPPPVAPGAAPGPGVAPGAPPPVPAAQPGLPPGAILTAPRQGQQELLAANIQAYNEDKAAGAGLQNSLNIGRNAYDAVKLAGATGPSTEWWNHVRALAAAQGINLGPSTGSETDQYQIARKNLLQWAQTNALTSVHSDLGLGTQLGSNPNVEEMTRSANLEALTEGIGRMRQRLAMIQGAPAGGVNHLDYRNQFMANTDPRGFTWNMYDPARQAAILKSLDADPTGAAARRLYKAAGIATKTSMDVPTTAPVQ
jgi:hypothetical protein